MLAPDNLGEKGKEICVLVQDWNGCVQRRQRFLHEPGDTPVLYQSAATQTGKVGDAKQIVLNLSKQHADKQGREAAELAPRGAARRWLMTRPFHTTEEEKNTFQIAAVASGFLAGWRTEKNCMVGGSRVWRMGLAVRVLAADFEEIMKLVQPDVWIAALLGPRCSNGFLPRLEGDSGGNVPPRLQTHVGRESGRTSSEHETAARLWPGSKHSWQEAKREPPRSMEHLSPGRQRV